MKPPILKNIIPTIIVHSLMLATRTETKAQEHGQESAQFVFMEHELIGISGNMDNTTLLKSFDLKNWFIERDIRSYRIYPLPVVHHGANVWHTPEPKSTFFKFSKNDWNSPFQKTDSINLTAPYGSIVLADMNGDHHLDLILLGNQVSLSMNDREGHFTSPVIMIEESAGIPRIMDVEGDGDMDLIGIDTIWINVWAPVEKCGGSGSGK